METINFFQENGTAILAILGLLATLWAIFSFAINAVVGPRFSVIDTKLAVLEANQNNILKQLSNMDSRLDGFNSKLDRLLQEKTATNK